MIKVESRKGLRDGRGASLGELNAAGISIVQARRMKLRIDMRRRSAHDFNIVALKDALSKIKVPPTKRKKQTKAKAKAKKVTKVKKIARPKKQVKKAVSKAKEVKAAKTKGNSKVKSKVKVKAKAKPKTSTAKASIKKSGKKKSEKTGKVKK